MSFPKPSQIPMGKYGPKITREQYERIVLDLNASLPPMSTPEQERALRRGELNAMIDRKLGVSFPDDKREQLFEAQQKASSRLLWNLAKGFLSNPLDPSAGIVKPLVRGFYAVLSRDEMVEYFDMTPEEIDRFL